MVPDYPYSAIHNKCQSIIGQNTSNQNLVMNYDSVGSSNLQLSNTVQPSTSSSTRFTSINSKHKSSDYKPLLSVLPQFNKGSEALNVNVGIIKVQHFPEKYFLLENQNIKKIPKSKIITHGTIRLNHDKSITIQRDRSSLKPKISKKGNHNQIPHTTIKNSAECGGDGKELSQLNKVIEPVNDSFCSPCNVDCGSLELLQDHKEKKPIICRVCTGNFDTHLELEAHFVTHTLLTCNKCSKVFHSRRDLKHHRTSSKQCNNNVECDICHKMVSSLRYGLQRHKKINHSKIVQMYDCIVCEKRFKFPKLLLNHLSLVHTAFENIECDLCKKPFPSPAKLKVHIKKTHIESSENAPVRCTICDQVYKNMLILRDHMATHDDKVRLCELCGMSIKGVLTLKWHMIKEHSKTGKFVCKFCNQQFNQEILLLRHRRRIHSNRSIPSPAFCEICGKTYKTSTILKSHMLIHSDEKPFKCEICGAKFKQKVTLKTHGRIHSSIGKYICDGCGESFKWKQTFDKHLKKCERTKVTHGDNADETVS